MNQIKHSIALLLLCLATSLMAQNESCGNLIQSLIIETQNELDEKFERAGIRKEVFIESFENYFLSRSLVEEGTSKGELYKNILQFLVSKGTDLPPVTEAGQVAFTAGRLRITIEELEENDQMLYLSNNYERYKESCPMDTISAFYNVGDLAKTISGMRNLSNNHIAYTLNMFLTEEDLNQKFYQETIVMIFWFRMALYYGE